MFPDYICQNIDILAVINDRKNNFGFHGNRKTQGHKHQLNNLYFKYQVCQMKLRHLNTFLQFRLLFHEPHCMLRLCCVVCCVYPTIFAKKIFTHVLSNISGYTGLIFKKLVTKVKPFKFANRISLTRFIQKLFNFE